MKSLLPIKFHTYIYIFALCLLAIGMPVSKFLMSLSQIILIANWLLEGNHKQKFAAFIKNKPALVLCSLLLLHFIGLIYTSDFAYAFKDIRIKSPLFVLPLIISTSTPLSEKLFNTVVKLLIASVFFSTLVSILVVLGIYKKELDDARGLSIFISHIRFALLICISFYFSIHYFKKASSFLSKILWFALICWWPLFMLIIQSMTGLAILAISGMCIGLFYLLNYKNGKYRLGIVALIIAAFISVGYELNYMKNEISPESKLVDFSNLAPKTKYGHPYLHDVTNLSEVNGNRIWINVCEPELDSVWRTRSIIAFNSMDKKENLLKDIIIRFLTSKGLTKDADGLQNLSDDEIKAIENGVANVKYMSIGSLKKRVYETLWEIDLYNKTRDASGHSLTQRFEYWKTAGLIIKNNLIFGVGTGDIANAFDSQYIESNSLLEKEWRLRSHNQYLSITVAFGLIGLIWFLFSLFYPPIKMGRIVDFIYLSFFCIALLSFFTEDTLETQAGVTFYAFINCFLLFARENSYSIKPSPDYIPKPLLWRNFSK